MTTCCPGPRAAARAALLALLLAANPVAADVGEIALVEDTKGEINAAGLLVNFYLGKAACAFLQSHPESHDALFFFTTIPQNPITNTPAGWRIRPIAKGVGADLWPDGSAGFCATGRLRHAVRMGDLATLPDDPDGQYTGVADSPFTGIQVLGHELGHQWLALADFDKGDGQRRCLLRGFVGGDTGPTATPCDGYGVSSFNVHWSRLVNASSLMCGSTIEVLGGGRFRLSTREPRYSPLDQYLMGLRDAADVPAMFVVDTGNVATSDSAAFPPPPGQTVEVTGTRLDFTVEDVIRALGPRVPARDGCHWKGAFVIVHAAGQPPSAAAIAKVERYRARWETFYAAATDGRGSFDTTLAGTGQGTTGCPVSGVQPDAGRGAQPDAGRGARDRGAAGGTDAGAVHAAGAGGGCGCTTAKRTSGDGGSALLVAALLVAGLRRPRGRRAGARRRRTWIGRPRRLS